MTEYWVSQAKHYCKYCNIWIADNKPSRQHHENSVKHKISLDKYHQTKREQTLHGARSERELKQQLVNIEKAAKEAMQSDPSYKGEFYQNSKLIFNSRPPPPPPSSSSLSSNEDYKVPENEAMFQPSSDDTKNLRSDSTGVYEIRGQTYLEGAIHESKLREGVSCEIFLEREDVWLPARVLKKKEISVPHTSIVLKSFDISYFRTEAFTDKRIPAIEENVKADRLRLLVSKEEAATIDNESEEKNNNLRSNPPTDEFTGLGMWQTISVEVIDEVAQEEERLQLEAAELIQKQEQTVAAAKALELARMIASKSDGLLQMVDPNGTGMYKGMFIGGVETIEEPKISLSKGEKVEFKKRKRPNTFIASDSNIVENKSDLDS